jgi:hypothetical protein
MVTAFIIAHMALSHPPETETGFITGHGTRRIASCISKLEDTPDTVVSIATNHTHLLFLDTFEGTGSTEIGIKSHLPLSQRVVI